VNEVLSALEREFAALNLLRAMLLQTFYSIRSERLLMERLEYDLLFRWFVGIGVDDAAWDHSVFKPLSIVSPCCNSPPVALNAATIGEIE
jgi:hypothetical protein